MDSIADASRDSIGQSQTDRLEALAGEDGDVDTVLHRAGRWNTDVVEQAIEVEDTFDRQQRAQRDARAIETHFKDDQEVLAVIEGEKADNRTSFKCTSTDIGPQNAEAKTIEADANSFASQLILPDYLVWPWVGDRKPSLDLANEMGGDFQASLTACALKLLQCAKVPTAISCHDQRRLKWSRRSRNFSTDFYILNELHQDTIAFEMAFGSAKGLSRPKRESASRWVSGPGSFRRDVWSQSIKLPEGSVLTMISVV